MTKKQVLTALGVISGRLKINELTDDNLSDLGFSQYHIKHKDEYITDEWVRESAEKVVYRAIVGIDE